jgi:hypothetical protein
MLKEHLRTDFIIDTEENTVMLIESAVSAKLKNVKINEIADDTLVIKTDAIKEDNYETLPKIFQSDRVQYRRRCDYVLITNLNGKKYLVFIEMKSDQPHKQDVVAQFRASDCLLEYIKSLIESFDEKKSDFVEYKKRYVCFQTKRFPKRTTYSKDTIGKGKTPDSYLIVNNVNNSLPRTLKSLIRH